MKRRDFLVGMVAAVPAFAGATRESPLHALSPARRPPRPDLRYVERWSWVMGQPVQIRLFAETDDQGYEAAALALAELRRVESKLSLFDSASDLVALNEHAGLGAFRADADLLAILRSAESARLGTAGAFDVAVEPLMRAWGFHARRTHEPSALELAEAREAVQAAVVRIDGNRISLPVRETRLDLGGIGVGYGLDRAGAVLRARGIERALIDVSGDLLALGAPPGEVGWRVGVADPSGRRRELTEVRLADRALATSANTMSTVRYGRAVRGHVMDPASGYPADAAVQTTVIARRSVDADALSTAMLVSGKRASGVEWSWVVRG
jgi:thiamine biosynthesis lipoprotein